MSEGNAQLSLAGRVAAFHSIIDACEMTRRGDDSIIELEQGMRAAMEMLLRVREHSRGVYVVGNGGSASVASHMVTDLLNVMEIRAYAVHDASLMTCMANDYGYENAYARILSGVAREGDLLIAISSPGRSENIRNAVHKMQALGGETITLSGFDQANPLRALGDLNIWLDSNDYGFVEVGHQFILHNMIDRFAVK